MKKCDCDKRIGVEINSYHFLEDLKNFFESRVKEKIFIDIPVELPYFCGYGLRPEEVEDSFKQYADKWYRCQECGTLWEFKYPDFPAKGFVRKFSDGKHRTKE